MKTTKLVIILYLIVQLIFLMLGIELGSRYGVNNIFMIIAYVLMAIPVIMIIVKVTKSQKMIYNWFVEPYEQYKEITNSIAVSIFVLLMLSGKLEERYGLFNIYMILALILLVILLSKVVLTLIKTKRYKDR